MIAAMHRDKVEENLENYKPRTVQGYFKKERKIQKDEIKKIKILILTNLCKEKINIITGVSFNT